MIQLRTLVIKSILRNTHWIWRLGWLIISPSQFQTLFAEGLCLSVGLLLVLWLLSPEIWRLLPAPLDSESSKIFSSCLLAGWKENSLTRWTWINSKSNWNNGEKEKKKRLSSLSVSLIKQTNQKNPKKNHTHTHKMNSKTEKCNTLTFSSWTAVNSPWVETELQIIFKKNQ